MSNLSQHRRASECNRMLSPLVDEKHTEAAVRLFLSNRRLTCRGVWLCVWRQHTGSTSSASWPTRVAATRRTTRWRTCRAARACPCASRSATPRSSCGCVAHRRTPGSLAPRLRTDPPASVSPRRLRDDALWRVSHARTTDDDRAPTDTAPTPCGLGVRCCRRRSKRSTNTTS